MGKKAKTLFKVNYDRLKNKSRKPLVIPNEIIKEEWDKYKSVKSNLLRMGLTVDPNERNKNDKEIEDTKVIKELKSEAAQARDKPEMILGEADRKFCIHLIDTYGDSDKYNKMARDEKNIYQKSAGQIRKLLNRFRTTKHYRELNL